MEMLQRYQTSDSSYEFGGANSGGPWYRQKKNIILAGLAIIAAIIIFVGGYFVGAYQHPGDEVESTEPTNSELAFLPIKWVGVCPKKVSKCPSSFQGSPPLIMISLDGFRPDYFDRGLTPTIKNLAKCGSSAPFMFSVFPTKTFPNHYSQVTGLYPTIHGIVDNNMYDPSTGKLFKVGQADSLSPEWWLKEPIWATAEKQGKKTACFFWPGSDVKINNTLPSYFKKYSSKIPFEARVDQILKWLELPEGSRPSFLTLYVNQPDNAAHHYGVNSPQTNQALTKVDNMVARLISGLQQRNLAGCVNIIIVSDHGMSDVDCKKVVDIKNYVNVSEIFTTMGPFGRVRPKGKRNESKIKDMISKLRCNSEHMRVYPKEQLPVRMHYADNRRVEPIFLDLDAGWTVVSKGVRPGDEICSGGAHGYDNLFSDMRAIFMAYGPSFKSNNTVRPFINTELYEMMCELINVRPNPNNGTRGSLHHLLTSPKSVLSQFEPESPAISEVPKDEAEYNYRVYAANCSCQQTNKQVDIEDTSERNNLHLPFGIPYGSEDNNTLRMLYNDDYVSAFDLKYRIPMWSSFTLTGLKNDKVDDVCFTGDARIPIGDTAKCGDYSTPRVKKLFIVQRPLYSPGFSDSSSREQATYVSNSIPKSLNHSKIIESKLNQILSQWASDYGQLNVVMGPAFDLYATGLRPHIGKIMKLHETDGPLVVPTHIFAVATWCSEKVETLKKCQNSKLETQAFLLPNEPYTQNCEPGLKVIAKNVARVVDIEKLTGLSFFTGLPVYDALRLKIAMPEKTIQ